MAAGKNNSNKSEKTFPALLSDTLLRARNAARVIPWQRWFKRPTSEVTVVLLTKGHQDVRKVHFSPKTLWGVKLGIAGAITIFVMSTIFFVDFLIRLPDRSLIHSENIALKRELNRIQFHLDTLQLSVDRMTRFDQKLRALTEIDKEFSKIKGPTGQGGSDANDGEMQLADFGDYKIDTTSLQAEGDSIQALDRREAFLVQKIYSWMKRLYGDSQLQEQSLEELFEVLKGREIQLSATPSILPVRGWVTSHFGYRIDPFTGRRTLHKGLDVVARVGAPIVAPAEGVVSFSGPYGTFGNAVMIFHGYGISTLYAHTNQIQVRAGQKVKRGDVVALVGNTGRSTGAHLHYEVIVHGVPVDPRKYVLDRSF